MSGAESLVSQLRGSAMHVALTCYLMTVLSGSPTYQTHSLQGYFGISLVLVVS